jgi:hypothetical protein
VCNDCAGRGRASTAGLQHAPSGSVDAVERVTRGLRIEGLAAASASTFFPRKLVARDKAMEAVEQLLISGGVHTAVSEAE